MILRWLACVPLVCGLPCCDHRPSDQSDARNHLERLNAMARDIAGVMRITEKQSTRLARDIEAIYPSIPERAATVAPSQYRVEPNGVLHRPDAVRLDLPAVFVSGRRPVTDAIQQIVRGTEIIDEMLKRIPLENQAVVQAYYNDRNSYNRIYPPFDVLSQYSPDFDIPSCIFYYLADQTHNPDRRTVWVRDPYVDPAGRGWTISCIAPVYHRNELEGVCGLDITVESLVRNFDFDGRNALCLLAAADGTVVAAGEPMIRILRLPALKRHRYVDTIRSDTFRSADYNILKSRSLAIRELAGSLLTRGETSAALELDNDRWLVHAVRIPGLDWSLMEFHHRK